MPRALQHRIVLVGVEGAVEQEVRTALRSRNLAPVASVPDPHSAVEEARTHLGDAHLFIVQLPPGEDPAVLSFLSEHAIGQPLLVLLPPSSDLTKLLAAQRAGAAQVLLLPWNASDFQRALEQLSIQFVLPVENAQVLAVCGVSGGCGATTVALTLAYLLAESGRSGRGRTTLLVELARQVGTLATYLDIEPSLTVRSLLTDPSRLTTTGIRQALTSIAPGFDVLVGDYLDITPGSVPTRHVCQLIELCRRLSPLVVLDVPCTFDDTQFETLALADEVVLVGVQSVSSIRTMEMVRDTLQREVGLRNLRLVINRYEPTMPGFSAARLAELLRVPQVFPVANDYPSVMAALNHGKPLPVAVPHSRVVADLQALTRSSRVSEESAPRDRGDRLARTLGQRPGTRQARRAIRVLHVEDDPVQQQSVALHLSALEEYMCTISAVSGERAALELFTPGEFDVVLLDYHLEQGNGLECLRKFRTIDALVPIVVVSGLAQPLLAAELLEAGADDFLSKENISGPRLGRAIAAAVARADACKPRGSGERVADDRLDRVRNDRELLICIEELQEAARPGQINAGRIQRLVEIVGGELTGTATPDERLRRALLALFLRLLPVSQDVMKSNG